jgi:hypothetical protein
MKRAPPYFAIRRAYSSPCLPRARPKPQGSLLRQGGHIFQMQTLKIFFVSLSLLLRQSRLAELEVGG